MQAKLSAGAIRASYQGSHGVARGRILSSLPYVEDFEMRYEFTQQASDGVSFSYPHCRGWEHA